MRRPASLAVLVALVVSSGCGVLDEQDRPAEKALNPAVYGPAKASGQAPATAPVPRLAEPSAAVTRALRAGEVGVVDLGGVVGVRPARLDTAEDVSVDDLRWSRWGADGATGSGTVRMLTCQPTCSNSGVREVPGRITLSGVKVCDDRRYFARGEVVIDPEDSPAPGRQPATYVRAPC